MIISRLLLALSETGKGCATVHGHSMEPLIQSGDTLDFERLDEYGVGDVVFCKVRGHHLVHKVIKREGDRYLIANNKGKQNGWTRQVFGRVVFD